MASSTSSHPQPGMGAWSRGTVLHSHPCSSYPVWDPSGHGHGGIPGTSAPWPKGWKGSKAVRACAPGQDQDVPKSGAEAAGRRFINSIQRSFGLFIYPAANSVCCINPHLEIIQRNPPAQPSPEAGHKPAAMWSCSTSSSCQQLRAIWGPEFLGSPFPKYSSFPGVALPTACGHLGSGEKCKINWEKKPKSKAISSFCAQRAQEAANPSQLLCQPLAASLLHTPMARGKRDVPSVLPAGDTGQAQGWCWLCLAPLLFCTHCLHPAIAGW